MQKRSSRSRSRSPKPQLSHKTFGFLNRPARQPTLETEHKTDLPKEKPLASLVSNIQVQKKKDSSSPCVIAFANLVVPQVFDGVSYRDATKVVVKIVTESRIDDNSLEVERKIYMLAKRAIAQLTPHLLGGIFSSQCSDECIQLLRNSTNSEEKVLYEAWKVLRAEMIWKRLILHGKKRKEYEHLGASGILQAAEFKDAFKTMYYTITPKMKGVSLKDFFANKVYLRYRVPRNKFDILIAFQVAQALAVMELCQMRHNDLHDANVFIEYLETPRVLTYTYPYPFRISTQFVVTIFDFDHATTPMFSNIRLDKVFCNSVGECNNFIPSWDWYTFLVFFIFRLKQHMSATSPTPSIQASLNLLSIMPEDVYFQAAETMGHGVRVGTDAWSGRPCKCVRTLLDEKQVESCVQCITRTETLAKLQSPVDFFLKVLRDFPHGDFVA